MQADARDSRLLTQNSQGIVRLIGQYCVQKVNVHNGKDEISHENNANRPTECPVNLLGNFPQMIVQQLEMQHFGDQLVDDWASESTVDGLLSSESSRR